MEKSYLSAKEKFEASQAEGTSFFGVNLTNPNAEAGDPALARHFKATRDNLVKAYGEKIQFDQETRQIKAFQAAMENISSAFSKLGIEFKTNEFFASSDDDFAKLGTYARQAEELAKQLTQTANVAEQNKIMIQIEEIRTQVTKIKTESEKRDNTRKQFKLADVIGKVGGTVLPADLYANLADEQGDQLHEAWTKLSTRFEELQRKKPIDMSKVGTTYDKAQQKQLKDAFAQRSADYQTEYQKWVRDVMALNKRSQDMISAVQPYRVNEEIASGLGLDFNKLVKTNGYDKAVKLLSEFQNKVIDLSSAKRLGESNSVIASLSEQVDALRLKLEALPNDFQSMMSSLSALGTSLDKKDFALLDPKTFDKLRKTADQLKANAAAADARGEKFSQKDVQADVQAEMAAADQTFQAYLEVLYSTGERIDAAMGRLNLGDQLTQVMVPEHVFGDLLRLDTEMLSIQELMKKPMSVEAFKGLQVELLRAQTKLAELKQTFASFETRAGAFSGVYGSTSKEDMLNMNPTEFLQYSQVAMALQARMEQLNKTPLVNTNGTITNDFR